MIRVRAGPPTRTHPQNTFITFSGKRKKKNKNAQVPVKAPRVLTKAPKLTTKVDVVGVMNSLGRVNTIINYSVGWGPNITRDQGFKRVLYIEIIISNSMFHPSY